MVFVGSLETRGPIYHGTTKGYLSHIMWLFTYHLHAHPNLARESLKHPGLPHDDSLKVQITSFFRRRKTVVFGLTFIPRYTIPDPYWISHCLF
jgi:hypothetical protein